MISQMQFTFLAKMARMANFILHMFYTIKKGEHYSFHANRLLVIISLFRTMWVGRTESIYVEAWRWRGGMAERRKRMTFEM